MMAAVTVADHGLQILAGRSSQVMLSLNTITMLMPMDPLSQSGMTLVLSVLRFRRCRNQSVRCVIASVNLAMSGSTIAGKKRIA